MKEEEILDDFISVNELYNDLTRGKYAAKDQDFFASVSKRQMNRQISKYDIKPIQFTFEITNKCNCNCKDCGMAANRLETTRTVIEEKELIKMIDDLDSFGIPGIAITGGEPFLAFDKMCSMFNHSRGKIDIIKIISNGFWGKNVEYYFKKLEENGFFENRFFIPTIQISIGEQTVPFEYICNIINYVATHYNLSQLKLGIIHTKENGLKKSKLLDLYEAYINIYGPFPRDVVYLTDSYYVNANPLATEKIDVVTYSAYNWLTKCDITFKQDIGLFVSPKIFMKCNGDCYPCEVFNIHQNMYLGNYFEDGIETIMNNYINNKYIRFIKDYGTVGFRDVIPKKVLESRQCETTCSACEFCIKFCEENHLIR